VYEDVDKLIKAIEDLTLVLIADDLALYLEISKDKY